MATITAAELAGMVEAAARASADLVKASALIDQHIARKAQDIAAERSKIYAKAADERIQKVTDEAAIEIQRRDDVITELGRQMRHLERHAERCFRLEKAIKAAFYNRQEHIAVESLMAIMNAPAEPVAAEPAPAEHHQGG